MTKHLTTKAMIDELKEYGFNQKIIADELEVSSDTVWHWYNENRITSNNRKKLKELHRQIVGSDEEEESTLESLTKTRLNLLDKLCIALYDISDGNYGWGKEMLENMEVEELESLGLNGWLEDAIYGIQEMNYQVARRKISMIQRRIIGVIYRGE